MTAISSSADWGFRLLIMTVPDNCIELNLPLEKGQEPVGSGYLENGKIVLSFDLGDMGKLLTQEQYHYLKHERQVADFIILPAKIAEEYFPNFIDANLCPGESWCDASTFLQKRQAVSEWARTEFSRSKNVRIYP